MNAYNLLSEPIRKYIRDKNWTELRPIQTYSIQKILKTDNNYVISARTASGKTEAAFLPILTKVDFKEKGVQVLYISPLIALINDQFKRIEELCTYLEVSITKWHGEANRTKKRKLIKHPNGILLITPESIEAMFCNRPHEIHLLFSNLKFIVIDEIHSFLGSNRGIQLNSLIYRIQSACKNQIRIISLSATIGEYQEIKKIGGNPNKTIILLDNKQRENEITFKFFQKEAKDLPLDLIKDLFHTVRHNKSLIFPNNRGLTEEITHKLKRIANITNDHTNYFAHHSSINKNIREFIENFAKQTTLKNFSIACTSTLELGIDIGSVDKVVQIDSTYSVSSLIQRIGRSGRKKGQKSIVVIYSTNKWSLIQSVAIWELYQKDFIDAPHINKTPFDIALHQILSIIKSNSGISAKELLKQLSLNYSFQNITIEQFQSIINHLVKIDFLEYTDREYIIGLTAEKAVNNKEFYSVFETESLIPVIYKNNLIGEVLLSPQIKSGENILLASKVWKIIELNPKSKKIYVEKAQDGRKPIFGGSAGDIAKEIRFEMLHLLTSKRKINYLDKINTEKLEELKDQFKNFNIINIEYDRPVVIQREPEESIIFYTFNSTIINRTIELLLSKYANNNNIKYIYKDYTSSFSINVSFKEFIQIIDLLPSLIEDIESYLKELIESNPLFLDFAKWVKFLPLDLQIEMLKNVRFDFEGTKLFLQNVNITYLEDDIII